MFDSFKDALKALAVVILVSFGTGVAAFILTEPFGIVLQVATGVVSFLLVASILYLMAMARFVDDMQDEMQSDFGEL